MTQPNTESKLDRHRRKRSYRLETLSDMVLLAIQQQSQSIQAEIQSTRTKTRQSIENMVQMIATLAESVCKGRKLILGVQIAITGIQTESRQTLDYSLNR